MAARVRSATHAVIASDLGETVLFVSHGGPIRTILAEALDIPLRNLFPIAQRYGAVNRIRFDAGLPTVEVINAVDCSWPVG